MKYHELSEEDKKTYGQELLDMIKRRKEKGLGYDNIEDYWLVELSDGSKGWIYYPDID